MTDQRGRVVWSAVCGMAVAISLWSLVPAQSFTGTYGCCLNNGTNGTCFEGTNASCSAGSFAPDQMCASDNSSCVPSPSGCCESLPIACDGEDCPLTVNECEEGVSQVACDSQMGNFVENATCIDLGMGRATTSYEAPGQCATFTPDLPTSTPTPDLPTATPTMIPPGSACEDQSDCDPSNFCVDDVCCESTCDGPEQSCDQPGFEGICRDATMAPASSGSGLLALVLALAAVGIFAVSRRYATSRRD